MSNNITRLSEDNLKCVVQTIKLSKDNLQSGHLPINKGRCCAFQVPQLSHKAHSSLECQFDPASSVKSVGEWWRWSADKWNLVYWSSSLLFLLGGTAPTASLSSLTDKPSNALHLHATQQPSSDNPFLVNHRHGRQSRCVCVIRSRCATPIWG